MNSLPVCDVAFGDGTRLGAFLIVRFGERWTIQITQLHHSTGIRVGQRVTVTVDGKERTATIAWAPVLSTVPTLLILELQPATVLSA